MNEEGDYKWEGNGMYGGNTEIIAKTKIYKMSVKTTINCYSWSRCDWWECISAV
jgi:hypothetical protein